MACDGVSHMYWDAQRRRSQCSTALNKAAGTAQCARLRCDAPNPAVRLSRRRVRAHVRDLVAHAPSRPCGDRVDRPAAFLEGMHAVALPASGRAPSKKALDLTFDAHILCEKFGWHGLLLYLCSEAVHGYARL